MPRKAKRVELSRAIQDDAALRGFELAVEKRTSLQQRYARFHTDYADVGKYFDRVANRFGLSPAGNRSGNRSPEGAAQATASEEAKVVAP